MKLSSQANGRKQEEMNFIRSHITMKIQYILPFESSQKSNYIQYKLNK